MTDVTAQVPPARASGPGIIVWNIIHLGMGQVATTLLGIALTAALGRALGASSFGDYYLILTICGFVSILVDWGQSTYVIVELSRGRSDEPEFLGSALLNRTVGTGVAAVLAAFITMLLGYDGHMIVLAVLAVLVGLPYTQSQPFSFVFRSRNRMDFDAIATVIAKVLTLAATILAFQLGSQLEYVFIAQAVGGVGALVACLYFARRMQVRIKSPTLAGSRDLLFSGAPVALFSFALAIQPMLEMMILTRFAESHVVGWYGASRTILGTIIAPAAIFATAAFPEVSRASRSLPDFRRILAENARLLLCIGALGTSFLYVCADSIIATIYGHRSFAEAAAILRAAAPFMPLLFLGFLLGGACSAVKKNREMSIAKGICVIGSAIVAWVLVGYFQAQVGNGAIALVVTSGAAEVFMLMAFVRFLPKGAVTVAMLYDIGRSLLAALSTVLLLILFPPLSIWIGAPIVLAVFVTIAFALKLIVRNDFDRMVGLLGRTRGPAPMD